ncbi:MAG TPA: bifunctional 5,10-methylenetetrahydrofolate dehydrogenase/5,10-methenyltetrahydrofolate cyclohydrolase [Candidatus Peribacteraceae bacterium]|nr:bifunctional 5,10-methylenetetrahydrofolate dehydrogenase/5,10-methenyltetrahydrofolate cyclohydrolase [Candidatus Peribacteraceae bacterium]
MSARIIDGSAIADRILEGLKPHVKRLDPKLTIVQVGNDPASDSYIRKKLESCEKIGMRNQHLHFDADIAFETLVETIHRLNEDEDVTGYIVQLPLPGALQDKEPLLFREIDPYKDVDGFTAYNIGKMFLSRAFEHLPPATPAGIITLLEHEDIAIEGKCAVVVGHSNIVGKPLGAMLLNRNATLIQCHKYTKDLAHYTKQGDILISAVGKPNLITGDMVKPGAVVIDVGMNRNDSKLVGDVDFEEVKKIASAITPVPGGVGPMTVASLLRNCIRAKERQLERVS